MKQVCTMMLAGAMILGVGTLTGCQKEEPASMEKAAEELGGAMKEAGKEMDKAAKEAAEKVEEATE